MKQQDDRARGRILLVEDEDLSRWSVKTYLENRGYLVVDCPNGREAVSKLSEGHYDIIVTDLMLTDMNGLELTAHVHDTCPDTQVIVVTGRGSKESVISALRQGVYDYIEKPYQLEHLHLVVEKAMEKVGMLRELVRLSRTDGLTGLFNQRYFYEVLEKEINRARRQGHPLSLILLDVDSFKEYNDKHGHLAGDEALILMARCIHNACRRDVDVAFRYGGDEFIVVLPESDMEISREVSQRIKAMVAQSGPLGVSLSIGLAELKEGMDLKTFIRHADEAMYLAKQMGGDRAIVFSRKS